MSRPPTMKRRRVVLTLEKKREIIEKMEAGWTIFQISREYNVPSTTLYDIKKASSRIIQYQADFGTKTSKNGDRKVVSLPKHAEIDQTTLTWFLQQRAAGQLVQGREVKKAAEKFARMLNVPDFKASEGWLFSFKLRHGLTNRKSCGEALDAEEEEVEDFRQKLSNIIERAGLIHGQVYNADETGLFYRSLPTNTLINESENPAPDPKLSRHRVSVLCCANANGLHRLTPVIVGNAREPLCLRGMVDCHPVVWYRSAKAWFTANIFSLWFYQDFIPEVIRYQTKELGISRNQVKALLLLDNAPVHLFDKKLVAENGRIRVMFLPPSKTALIQPMEQGIVATAKRLYRRLFLNEVMVVLEDEEENNQGLDTQGQRTLENLWQYNLKSTVYNWVSAWKKVPAKTLESAWSPLLKGMEVQQDYLGFDVEDFQAKFSTVGEEVDANTIQEWLDNDGGDPGYQVLSEAKMAAALSDDARTEESDSDEGDTEDTDNCAVIPAIPRLSRVRMLLDELVEFVEHPDLDREMVPPGLQEGLRALRENVIFCQNRRTYRQHRIDSFFRPLTPARRSVSRTSSLTEDPELSVSETSDLPLEVNLWKPSEFEETPEERHLKKRNTSDNDTDYVVTNEDEAEMVTFVYHIGVYIIMEMYTDAEYADLHLMLGAAGGNAAQAARLYEEQYPNRRHPDPRTFTAVDRRLRERGSVRRFGADAGGYRRRAHQVAERKGRPVRKRKGTFITGPDYVSAYGGSDSSSGGEDSPAEAVEVDSDDRRRNEQIVMPKRKRGRPRKNEKLFQVNGEDIPAEALERDSGDWRRNEQIVVPKRKRGRPRKYEQVQKTSKSKAHPPEEENSHVEVYVDVAEDPEGCSEDSDMSPRGHSEISMLKEDDDKAFVAQEWDWLELDKVKNEVEEHESVSDSFELKHEDMVQVKEEK